MGGLNDYARLNFHFLPYISMIGVDHGEISLFQDHSKLDDMGDIDTWLVWLFPILETGVSDSRQKKEATLGQLGGFTKNKCLSYTWTFCIFLKHKTAQKRPKNILDL